jgi:hypothetical protein
MEYVHSATCNGCHQKYFGGLRYRFLDCPDFDYCSDCIQHADSTHPGHRFKTLSLSHNRTLCSVCTKALQSIVYIPKQAHEERSKVRTTHHGDLESLRQSALADCELCRVCYSTVTSRSDHTSDRYTFFLAMPYRLDTEIAPISMGVINIQVCSARQNNDRWYSPFLGIGLQRPESSGLSTVLGRESSLEPDLDLAKEWLHQCEQHHTICPSVGDQTLPTRLLDLSQHKVRLVESQGGQGRYVALSYCWGRPELEVLRTYAHNLQQHLEDIPFQKLAKTFQDAITVTRALGFDRLWVDSFCIVQDVAADWEREVIHMEAVFENAALTIAAAEGNDPTTGLLYKKGPMRLDRSDHGGGGAKMGMSGSFSYSEAELEGGPMRVIQRDGSVYAEELTKPLLLDGRAWVLQERLLSSRILGFGSDRMFFDCNSCLWLDTFHFPLRRRRHTTLDVRAPSSVHLAPKDILARLSQETALGEWYGVLDHYLRCSITMADDRLPAISSIVTRIQKHTQWQYVAGLWRHDILRGLLWWQQYDEKTFAVEPKIAAPSWSWAACPGKVTSSSSKRDDLRPEAQVDDIQVELAGMNPFGSVKWGRITITGFLSRVQHRAWDPRERRLYFFPDDLADERVLGHPLLDRKLVYDSLPGQPRRYYSLLLFSKEEQRHGCEALILEPVDGASDTFRRIGLLETGGGSSYGEWVPAVEAEAMLRARGRRTIHIV